MVLGSVIKGWDIGVATMKKNERAILTCAPEYAYGASGSPPTIPPDSTLKFDVSNVLFRIFIICFLFGKPEVPTETNNHVILSFFIQ